MGSSFYSRVANPKGDVPSNLGLFEGKGSRIKAQRLRWAFPSQITAKKIVKEKIFH
jgi:hypothetical protein